MDAVTLFKQLLVDNNLNITFRVGDVVRTEDGGLVIGKPTLIVTFNPTPQKEVNAEPTKPEEQVEVPAGEKTNG